MTVSVVDSGTIRRSGIISIGFGEHYDFDEAVLADTSGFLLITGKGSPSGKIYGGHASWFKGGTSVNPSPYAYNDAALVGYNTVEANADTIIGFAVPASKLGIVFVDGKLRILNNWGSGETIEIAFDLTIIRH